jgi:hypothetical protein
MIKHNFYADVASPIPSLEWKNLTEANRLVKINELISKHAGFGNELLVISAKEDGQIIVRLLSNIPPNIRGTLLLDFEAMLKNNLDDGLTVWGEPLGDKNSLRNLRGIEVKPI